MELRGKLWGNSRSTYGTEMHTKIQLEYLKEVYHLKDTGTSGGNDIKMDRK